MLVKFRYEKEHLGINQNQLAAWLEGDVQEGNGGDFENSALDKPLAPWGWARMNEICFGLCWHPGPGGNGICRRRRGILFFVFKRKLCDAWFRISQPAIPLPHKGWLVNTEC